MSLAIQSGSIFRARGNHWSFKHYQRLWSLPDNPQLKYEYLNHFDQAMVHFMSGENLMGGGVPQSLWLDQDKMLIAYENKTISSSLISSHQFLRRVTASHP